MFCGELDKHLSSSAKNRLPHVALVRVLAVLCVAFHAGCGSASDPVPSRSPSPQGSAEGRPIGGRTGPEAAATTAAIRFVRGYLAFQSGQLTADEVPDASRGLRQALKRARIPPATRDRETAITSAVLERIDARSAHVTVTVRNVDEDLTYPLPIDLIARGTRWTVTSAGDDA